MAMFDFTVPDGFWVQLGTMAEIERYAPKMIDESIPILEREVRKSLAKHKRTGLIVKSVKSTRAGYNVSEGVYFAVVRPTGKSSKYMAENGKVYFRKKQIRNMEIVAHIEYGTADQPAKPFLTKAYKDSEPAVLAKMKDVFTREVFGGNVPW